MNVMFGISRRIPLALSGLNVFVCLTQAEAFVFLALRAEICRNYRPKMSKLQSFATILLIQVAAPIRPSRPGGLAAIQPGLR